MNPISSITPERLIVAKSAGSRFCDMFESDEKYFNELLRRTYNEALISVMSEIDPSTDLKNCIIHKYVKEELSQIDHSQSTRELLKGLNSIKNFNMESELQSPRRDELEQNTQKRIFSNMILSSENVRQSWDSNPTPKTSKMANSTRSSLSMQSSYKPKLVYQSISALMADKENSHTPMNKQTNKAGSESSNINMPLKVSLSSPTHSTKIRRQLCLN